MKGPRIATATTLQTSGEIESERLLWLTKGFNDLGSAPNATQPRENIFKDRPVGFRVQASTSIFNDDD
jgi:hypothetical protein